MDKIKKIILVKVPLSICNFRCHYCYLAQRDEHYQGIQPEMKYSPAQVAGALSRERIGGLAFINICADGETLLLKDLDLYVKALLEEGHYLEIVTNCTVNTMLDKILALPEDMLKRLEFKCSFHYLELVKRGLLDRFVDNIHKIWAAGASVNIEITPTDELVPYIDEVKKFSIENFGALPHLSIARDDRTYGIDYLTSMSDEEYNKIWSQFKSEFWQFKRTIFGKKQTDFCYAGDWGCYVNLETGEATQCYCGMRLGNIFENPSKPLPTKAIGRCPIPHCYNGHALMSLGLIPNKYHTRYGDIRNRVRQDGTQWLQPQLLDFFNSKLEESNKQYNALQKGGSYIRQFCERGAKHIKHKFSK